MPKLTPAERQQRQEVREARRATRLVLEAKERLGDGRMSSTDLLQLLLSLASMPAARKAAKSVWEVIVDLFHRDSDELRDAAEKKRQKAAKALEDGDQEEHDDLIEEAEELETKALMREQDQDEDDDEITEEE